MLFDFDHKCACPLNTLSLSLNDRWHDVCVCIISEPSTRATPWVGSRSPDGWDQIPYLSQPRTGWVPDPPMVGIRSPIGLVFGSCTSHPGVVGSIPKREEPGKTGAPVLKYRVSHGSQCVMGRLVHTGLGSSSLVAHVLHSAPPPTRTAL
jgi:hypothetical protein